MSYIKQQKHAHNKHKLATGVGLGTAMLAGMMATTAHAAENTNNQVATLPEVSVTANKQSTPQATDYRSISRGSAKFTQPLAETPRTIQIIDEALIEDQHATTLTEALRNSAGVGTFYTGENGNTSTGDDIYMRGFDSSSSIYVDGVRDAGAVSRDMFNTEQVEVSKGPSGADYGRTAPGGSINLVSKRAHLGNDGSVTVSVGTDNQKRITADINREITDSYAFRLNLMGQDSDVPGRDKVNNKRWGIAPSVSFGLGTDTRLTINYMHVTQNNIPDGGVYTIGLPGFTSPDPATYPLASSASKVDQSNFYGTGSDFMDVKHDMATVLFEHDFAANGTLHNTLRWGRTEQRYLISAFMGGNYGNPQYDFGGTAGNPASWHLGRLANTKDQTNKIISNQLGVVQQLKTGAVVHHLSYGLELTREQLETTDTEVSSALPTVNVYQPAHPDGFHLVDTGASAEGEIKTAAIYLFDTLEIGQHWQVTAGTRLDHYDAEYKSTSECGGWGPSCGALPAGTVVPDVNASDSDNLYSWQLGVIYKINDQGNVYVDYAVASQPPGGAELEFSNSDRSANNPKYDPREAKTAEVGTKWKLSNGRLLLTAAVYRTTVTNLVEEDNTGVYRQTGEKRVQGVELTAVGRIMPNWNVSAGFTTMDAEITSGKSETNDPNSNTIAYTPDYALTSWTTYRLPFGLTVGGGVRYTDGLTRGSDGAPGTPKETDGYWVADAMASYAITEQLNVQLNLYNITDEDYVASINKSGYRYTPGEPRSAMLSVNYNF